MDLTDRLAHRLKLRDLRLLEVVVRSKSMARAAAQLHLTQPAVSKAMSELEKTLGVPLLERGRRGIEATPQGIALMRSGIAMIDDLRQGVGEIQSMSEEGGGELRLAAPDTMAGGMLPLILDRLREQHPRLSIRISPTLIGALEYRSPQYRLLRDREVDVVLGPIIDPFAETDLEAELLFDDKPIVVAGAHTVWARRRKIELAELLAEPWCMPPPDSPVGARCVAAFHACGTEPPPRMVVGGSTHLFKSLLATQHYIAILPTSLFLASADRRSLRALPIHLPIPAVPVGIVTLKRRALSPAARFFIAAAREVSRRVMRP